MEGEGKPCRHRHRHKHKHRREKARCVHGPSCAGEPHDSVGVEGNNGMVESVALSTSSMRPVLRPALKLSELRAYGLAPSPQYRNHILYETHMRAWYLFGSNITNLFGFGGILEGLEGPF